MRQHGLFDEEDPLPTRTAAHQMLRSLKDELPTQVAEAHDVVREYGVCGGGGKRWKLHHEPVDCNSRARGRERAVSPRRVPSPRNCCLGWGAVTLAVVPLSAYGERRCAAQEGR